jgi:single-strand DNA-binding protein
MLNQAQIIGRLGKDPEIRTPPGGQNVANFTLATTEKYKDRDGNPQERTEWHSCVAWGKLADIIGQYPKKGDLLFVQGKIETRSWEKDGVKQYKTEINVHEMKMLGGKRDDQRPDERRRDPAPAQRGGYGSGRSTNSTPPDDDIPF